MKFQLIKENWTIKIKRNAPAASRNIHITRNSMLKMISIEELKI